MSKKFFIVIAFIVLATSIFAAPGINGKFGIELRGGYAMINPSDLNALYTASYSNGFFNGVSVLPGGTDVTGTKLSSMAMGSGNFQYFLNPNFALYFRTDFLYCENSDQLLFPTETDPRDDSHIAFNVGYYGVGGRYYIGMDGVKGFFPYVSADVGMFMEYDSFWEIWINPDQITMPNTADQYQAIDFKDSFFGANIEVGAVYLFSDTVGISVGAGYRVATASLKVSPTSEAFTNILGSTTSVAANLGGIYLSGGINMYFGGSPAKAGAAAATGGTGAGAKYEQYGDYYMKQKNYAGALKYYGGAMKLDPKNAGIYKKIGMCYYYMKNMAAAKQYFTYYLRLNPDDAQMKQWLGVK
jgi:tetratricopeptide (TPR) repeat protein